MRMTLEIVAPGKQGAPAHGLPDTPAPQAVSADLPAGSLLYRGRMAARIALHGAEGYQGRYSAKWSESAPLAALANAHSYSGTQAPTDSLPRIAVTAGEMDPANLTNGAVRLRNLIAWLALCTVPWTRLGQPPLLRLRYGYLDMYGYLTEFDPQITEWMLDDREGKATGLPYALTYTLSMKREPLGAAVLDPRRGLPTTTQVPGGAGGLGADRILLPTGGR